MSLFAIDPGTTESAYVVLNDDGRVAEKGILLNDWVLLMLELTLQPSDRIVIEMVACYGMPVGAETFETCVWIGRFIQKVYPHPVELLTRNEVKMALCQRVAGVNDAILRRRLIDLYGPGRATANGSKLKPGPLYGIKSHMWSALALGVAALSRNESERQEVGSE